MNPEIQQTLWQLKGVVSDMDPVDKEIIEETAKKIVVALTENLKDKDEETVAIIFSIAMMQVMIDFDMELTV